MKMKMHLIQFVFRGDKQRPQKFWERSAAQSRGFCACGTEKML
jgi:hypothetical protein